MFGFAGLSLSLAPTGGAVVGMQDANAQLGGAVAVNASARIAADLARPGDADRPKFNPVKFDAAGWVRIAKDAGMRYIVITSKHHDGFCLFDSDATEWDVGVIVDPYSFGVDGVGEHYLAVGDGRILKIVPGG